MSVYCSSVNKLHLDLICYSVLCSKIYILCSESFAHYHGIAVGEVYTLYFIKLKFIELLKVIHSICWNLKSKLILLFTGSYQKSKKFLPPLKRAGGDRCFSSQKGQFLNLGAPVELPEQEGSRVLMADRCTQSQSLLVSANTSQFSEYLLEKQTFTSLFSQNNMDISQLGRRYSLSSVISVYVLLCGNVMLVISTWWLLWCCD